MSIATVGAIAQSGNLLSASITNRLMEMHDPSMAGGPHIDRPGPDVVIHCVSTHDLTFVGRFCTVGGERSGGYVIKGSLNERYEHQASLRGDLVERRLPPGWTKNQLQLAVLQMLNELHEKRVLKRHREQVYQLANRLELAIDHIDAIAKAEDREIAYDDMSIADCEFWKTELGKFIQPERVKDI